VDDATLESSAVGDSIAASVAPSFYDDGHSSASEASEEKDLASALNDATLESSVLSDSTAASISRSFDDGDNHSSASEDQEERTSFGASDDEFSPDPSLALESSNREDSTSSIPRSFDDDDNHSSASEDQEERTSFGAPDDEFSPDPSLALESSHRNDSTAASIPRAFDDDDDDHSSASEASEERGFAATPGDATLESSVVQDWTPASIPLSFDNDDPSCASEDLEGQALAVASNDAFLSDPLDSLKPSLGLAPLDMEDSTAASNSLSFDNDDHSSDSEDQEGQALSTSSDDAFPEDPFALSKPALAPESSFEEDSIAASIPLSFDYDDHSSDSDDLEGQALSTSSDDAFPKDAPHRLSRVTGNPNPT
jgi:hypothetical protein